MVISSTFGSYKILQVPLILQFCQRLDLQSVLNMSSFDYQIILNLVNMWPSNIYLLYGYFVNLWEQANLLI